MSNFNFESISFDHFICSLNAEVQNLVILKKISPDLEEKFLTNLLLQRVDPEILTLIDSDGRQTAKSLITKIKTVWSNGYHNKCTLDSLPKINCYNDIHLFRVCSEKLLNLDYPHAVIIQKLVENLNDRAAQQRIIDGNFNKIHLACNSLNNFKFEELSVSITKLICQHCGKNGHSVVNCFKLSTCGKCGIKGHPTKFCKKN